MDLLPVGLTDLLEYGAPGAMLAIALWRERAHAAEKTAWRAERAEWRKERTSLIEEKRQAVEDERRRRREDDEFRDQQMQRLQQRTQELEQMLDRERRARWMAEENAHTTQIPRVRPPSDETRPWAR